MSDAKVEKTSSKANASDDANKVKLLVTCIKHKTNDTINWQAVAEECEILGTDGKPSKGAASKRYDRILKAYNVEKPSSSKASSANDEDGSGTPSGTTRKKATPRKKGIKEETSGDEGGESPSKKLKRSPLKQDTPVEGSEGLGELELV